MSTSSRRAARVSRVRALEHDGRQRLRHADHGALPRRARGAARRRSRLTVMQSNGGIDLGGAAKAAAVRTILSGPAGGVGRRPRRRRRGRLPARHRVRHGRHVHRRLPDRRRDPARRPTRSSATFRCGCRSSTSTRSAPAADRSPTSTPAARCASGRGAPARMPGPACYGTGTELTVTDANLLLGRLDRRSVPRRPHDARRRPARRARRPRAGAPASA